MEELMAHQTDSYCEAILKVFAGSHFSEFQATGRRDHAVASAGLIERRVELLGKLQRFRDQGEANVQGRRADDIGG